MNVLVSECLFGRGHISLCKSWKEAGFEVMFMCWRTGREHTRQTID